MPPLWLGPFCQISNLASSPLAHAFRHISGTFYLFPTQLVVHSPKWSTSSRLSPQFQHFYLVSYPASGPPQRVDHLLAAFASVRALLPGSNPASGPLQRVDHWLRDSALYVTFPPYQKAPVLRTGATPPIPSKLLALGGI